MITVTDLDEQRSKIDNAFAQQVDQARLWRTSTAKERIARLRKILDFLRDRSNIDALCQALYEDLGKPKTEALTSEIMVVVHSLEYIIDHLSDWMQDRVVDTPLAFMGTSSAVRHESKGCALIISPWNYPFQLALNPVIYALAAGCTVILKPSEYSTSTSRFMQEMLHQLFDAREIRVFPGGVETAQHLLGKPFHHMYFTGSPAVGKIVMRSAAEHLSSITLELGGKSPCIVDEKRSPKKVANTIIWGKLYNNGQTCIAPDHLYVHRSRIDEMVEHLQTSITDLYGPLDELASNEDYGRIISGRHHERAVDLLTDAVQQGAEVRFGGQHDASNRYFSPTLLTGTTQDMKIMQEEIFAPILPIISYDDLVGCVEDINNRPKPLAMYLFSKRKGWIDQAIGNTTAGTTVVNDFLIQYANHNLPFGGVNNSGIGKSHGQAGFLAFTNERSIMRQHLGATKVLHPPYSNKKEKLAQWMTKWLG